MEFKFAVLHQLNDSFNFELLVDRRGTELKEYIKFRSLAWFYAKLHYAAQ